MLNRRLVGLALMAAVAASAILTTDRSASSATVRTITAPSLKTGLAAKRRFVTSSGPISAVWANDGGDKVAREEVRSRTGARGVLNSVWDGTQIRLFGARNEVVQFNLVLEAADRSVSDVTVRLDHLTGPNSFRISGDPTPSRAEVFDWRSRDIELFVVRYLQIRGLSELSYGTYDERHIPWRLRRPIGPDGEYVGGWKERPDHDRHYPDIAVPIEVDPGFGIQAGTNQSVWADIYIPKDAPPGRYTGEVVITTAGSVAMRVPVALTVRGFTLPDTPTSKTMVFSAYEDVAKRYTGNPWPEPDSYEDRLVRAVMDRQFQVAHRHKISLIDDGGGAAAWTQTRPRPEWMRRLDGSLFTARYGYRGPGEGVGNNVYSVGTYGQWETWWGEPSQAKMWKYTDAWESWFRTYAPTTERFLYLIDESEDYPQTQRWASWINANPGVGRALRSFATADLLKSRRYMPDLDVVASWFNVGDTATWQSAAGAQMATAGKGFYLYNGQRPGSGSFAIEDDGVALRELPWGQYKKGIQRWFFWNATYYDDFQGGRGETDVFSTAQSFGGEAYWDDQKGMTGWNASNGDGILFYPGRDAVYRGRSLQLDGPIASLRLKHWRRGIQDVDYVALARRIDPQRTAAVVSRMVPRVLWEVGVTDPDDPTWVSAPISWSTNPDVWEAARRELADIIEGR